MLYRRLQLLQPASKEHKWRNPRGMMQRHLLGYLGYILRSTSSKSPGTAHA